MDHTFNVQGMTCGHCEIAVRKAIQRLDTEAKIEIDRAHNKVQVHSTQPRERVAEVIAEEGYQVA